MQTRQFRARNMSEALRETRRVMGSEALIISARTIDNKTGFVEVTAVGGEDKEPTGKKSNKKEQYQPTDDIVDARPWEKSIEPLREDLVSLRRMVYELRKITDEAVLPGFNDLRTLIVESSQEQEAGRLLGPIYSELIDIGVMTDIARNILRAVEMKLGLAGADRRDWMSLARGMVRETLGEQIKIAGPLVPGENARVFPFIGPSGVGKTTTMAKLASRMSLSEGLNVVMMTTDTYRIGSVEQARRYAELIGIPLVVADRPETMAAAIRSYAEADAILVDTPGRAFEDEDVRNMLEDVLGAVGEPLESNLLISATHSTAQQESIVKSFSTLHPNRLIMTKIDEASQLGGLVNMQHISDLPFSYLTSGHRVPEDIEVAGTGRIGQLLFGMMD